MIPQLCDCIDKSQTMTITIYLQMSHCMAAERRISLSQGYVRYLVIQYKVVSSETLYTQATLNGLSRLHLYIGFIYYKCVCERETHSVYVYMCV